MIDIRITGLQEDQKDLQQMQESDKAIESQRHIFA